MHIFKTRKYSPRSAESKIGLPTLQFPIECFAWSTNLAQFAKCCSLTYPSITILLSPLPFVWVILSLAGKIDLNACKLHAINSAILFASKDTVMVIGQISKE